jgi:hypothetical protein
MSAYLGNEAQLSQLLTAAGRVFGRRVKEQVLQHSMQLDVWEDEGGASARPRFWNPAVLALPAP